MVFSGILVYLTADIVPRFSSNEVVLEYGRRYLKIAAFILQLTQFSFYLMDFLWV